MNADGYTTSDERARNQHNAQTQTRSRPSSNNLVTSTTDPQGNVTDIEYDELGRVRTVTRLPGTADEAVTTYTYDSLWKDRLATITDPLNHTTSFEYDAAGNQKSVIDGLNHKTSFLYDPWAESCQ